MILKWGDYSHDDNEVWFRVDKEVVRSSLGVPTHVLEIWTISGVKLATSTAALTTACNELQAVYGVDDRNLLFYLSDGTTLTTHGILVAQTLDGVKVRRFSWLEGMPNSQGIGSGSEYVLRRSFQIQIEAKVLDPRAVNLVSYRERVTQIGTGGPKRIWQGSLEQPPFEQIVQKYTTWRAIQEGTAVGLLDYPTPPAPIWPQYQWKDEDHVGSISTPDYGTVRNTNYPVSWRYVFESPTVLVGGYNVSYFRTP